MLSNIKERRVKLSDKYELYMEIPEKEYLLAYDNNINEENAQDVLVQYLNKYQDDGIAKNVRIKHDLSNHSVNIRADLIYEGNEHTEPRNTPDYLAH